MLCQAFQLFVLTLCCVFSAWHLKIKVGEDVVGELTKAMERVGLDMRVSALVSFTFLCLKHGSYSHTLLIDFFDLTSQLRLQLDFLIFLLL